MKNSFGLSEATDVLNKEIIDRKMRIPSLPTEKEKIAAIAELFPIYFQTLQKTADSDKGFTIFKWAFYDWADYVARHIKDDHIEIKDKEIDFFRDTLVHLFELAGAHKAEAYQFTVSKEAQDYIEDNFGYLNLIREIENLKDPQYNDYLNTLRGCSPVYPKMKDIIDESYSVASN